MSRLWFIAAIALAGIDASPAAAYDGSWYRNTGWSGEYPFGFTVTNDTTIDIRETSDPSAPKTISCQLKKGATYHQWNDKRVKSDQLEFISFTKIDTYEVKSPFKSNVSRQSDRQKVVVNFKKSDRWFYLSYLGEGALLFKFNNVIYYGDQDLFGKSTQISAKDEKNGYDEWLKLKCANGTVGWIFVKDIKTTPGFTEADTGDYGKASDQPNVKPSVASISAPERPSATMNAAPPTGSFSLAVPMKKDGGTYAVPVLINNAITLDFTVDSGATDVTIPADVVMTLTRTGTLSYAAFIGEKTYTLADGSKQTSKTFLLRSLKVGGKTVENVVGSIAPVQGGLLLGQSFLSRFKSWSIDNSTHSLLLNE